jgi:hypothetical protein
MEPVPPDSFNDKAAPDRQTIYRYDDLLSQRKHIENHSLYY